MGYPYPRFCLGAVLVLESHAVCGVRNHALVGVGGRGCRAHAVEVSGFRHGFTTLNPIP